MLNFRENRQRKKLMKRSISGALAALMTLVSVLGTPMSAFASTPMLSGNGTTVRSDQVSWSDGHGRVSVTLDPRTTFLAAKEALSKGSEVSGDLKDVLSGLEDTDGFILMGNMDLYELALPEEVTEALGDDAVLRVFVSPNSIEYGPGFEKPVKTEEETEAVAPEPENAAAPVVTQTPEQSSEEIPTETVDIKTEESITVPEAKETSADKESLTEAAGTNGEEEDLVEAEDSSAEEQISGSVEAGVQEDGQQTYAAVDGSGDVVSGGTESLEAAEPSDPVTVIDDGNTESGSSAETAASEETISYDSGAGTPETEAVIEESGDSGASSELPEGTAVESDDQTDLTDPEEKLQQETGSDSVPAQPEETTPAAEEESVNEDGVESYDTETEPEALIEMFNDAAFAAPEEDQSVEWIPDPIAEIETEVIEDMDADPESEVTMVIPDFATPSEYSEVPEANVYSAFVSEPAESSDKADNEKKTENGGDKTATSSNAQKPGAQGDYAVVGSNTALEAIAADLGLDEELKAEKKLAAKKVRASVPFTLEDLMAEEGHEVPEDSLLLQESPDLAEEVKEVLTHEITGKETFWILTGSRTGKDLSFSVKIGENEIVKKGKIDPLEGDSVLYRTTFTNLYHLFSAEGDGVKAEVVTLAQTKFIAKHNIGNIERTAEEIELYAAPVYEDETAYADAGSFLSESGAQYDAFSLYDISFLRDGEEHEPEGKGQIVDVALSFTELPEPETEEESVVLSYSVEHLITDAFGSILDAETVAKAEADLEERTPSSDEWIEVPTLIDSTGDSYLAVTEEDGAAASFAVETFSLFALTCDIEVLKEPGVDISDHPLVEVEESPDEELLSEEFLSPATRALLGAGASALQPAKAGVLRKSLRSVKNLLMAADPEGDAGGEGETAVKSKKEEPEPTEGAVSGDGVEISKVTVRWNSKSTGEAEPAGFDDLKLTADGNIVGNQQFQIDFSLSGKDDHEAGSVELVFPAWIWKDRYDEEPGYLTLSVPEDPEKGADFAWKRVGDYIIITNTRRLSAAAKVMIQGTFRDVKPYDMVDINVDPDSDYAGAYSTGRSDPFWAVVNLLTPNENTLSMTSNSIYAEIDTHVVAASATKSAYNTSQRVYYTYHSVEKAKAAGIPEEFLDQMTDPDEYSYTRWYAAGSATGSQPFIMTIEDTFDDTVIHYLDTQHEQSETLHVTGRMLGVQGAIDPGTGSTVNVPSEDGVFVTAMLYNGYNDLPKSAYIWTAYKKSDFPVEGDEYRIQNTQVTTVTGWDDMIPSTKEATAAAPFRIPIVYTVKKVWNDAGHEERRPKHQSVLVYYNEDLKTLEKKRIEAGDDNDWTISWDDEGTGRQYKVRELGMYGNGWEAGHEEDDAYLRDGSDYSYSSTSPNFMQVGNSEFSHTINRVYDEDKELKEYDTWWYSLEKEEYDSETRTWIKYNKYNEQHTVRNPVPFKMQKAEVGIYKNRVNYGDNNRMATSDRALNILRRGDDVIVDYNVSGYGYIIDLTKGVDLPGLSITDFGFRDVRLELEDNYGEDTHKGTTNNTFLFDSELRLTPDDVEVAYVELTTPTYYRYYQPDKYSSWTFRTMTNNDFAGVDRPNEELWGLNGGEWVRYATLSVSGDGSVSVSAENDATQNGRLINFPAGVFKVKTIMVIPGLKDAADIDRRIDGARMGYRIGVRLLAQSETLQNRLTAVFEANDYGMCTLDNYATINAYEDNGDLAVSLDDQSRVWLHGRNHREAVMATKSFVLTENDVINRRLKMHAKVVMTQQSNILERAEYDEAVKEGLIPHTDIGTWYDLLPMAVLPDISTIKLGDGDKLIDAYTVENYKGSGRTLLVVKADVADHISYTYKSSTNPYYNDDTFPKEGYKNVQSIEFDAWYAWDQAMLYGLDSVRNVAAYEAVEERLGNINGWSGEPDDPQKNHNQRAMNAVGDDKILMTGLDPSRFNDDGEADHMAFVYAGALLKHEEVDFAAKTELQKFVTKDGLGVWTNGRDGEVQVNLYEGDYYTYMLHVLSGTDTYTKDMVIIDAIEDYVPGADKAPDYGHPQWKGDFVSLDVSGLEALGVSPVIYYYTGSNAHEEVFGLNDKNKPLKNGAITKIEASSDWSTALPADPADVTAFAIDARHKADGSDFQLEELEAFSIYVRMRAKVYETSGEDTDPFNADEELRKDPDYNDRAFNDAFLDCTQIDPIGQETYAYIQHEYVRVGIIPFELKVRKIWDDAGNNDGKRPGEITVYPLANGEKLVNDEGVVKKLVLNDANHWEGIIDHLIRYDDEGNWISYTFAEETEDEAFKETFANDYTMSFDREDNDVTITNKHVPETTGISFKKQWIHDHEEDRVNMPESITVRLMADETGTGTGTPEFTGKTLVVKPDRNGNWEGSFTDLPKYANPTGVSGRAVRIRYTVEEESVYKYLTTYAASQEDEMLITNEYYPYGDLKITKTVLDNATEEAKKKEFTFTLVLKDRENNDLTEKYTYIKTDTEGNTAEGTIGNGGTFTLKGNETFLVKDIPSESYYEVSEGETAGFELAGSSGTVSTIRAGSVRTAEFINRYTASGKQPLSLTKTLTGRSMSRNQFWFELVDLNEGSPTQYEIISTTAADADGNASFADLKYTEADDGKTFTYAIRETDRKKPGYTYDGSAFLVTVKVEDKDGNGKLTCTPAYYKAAKNEKRITVEETDPVTGETSSKDKTVTDYSPDGEAIPAEGVSFANEYHASGSIKLNAWKQLPGGNMEEGDFYFLLYDYTPGSANYGKAVLGALNNAAGRVVFEDADSTPVADRPLSFTEQDVGKTFLFVAKEYPGEDTAISYTEKPRGYEITVADNGNGTLAVTQTNVDVIENPDGTFTKTGETKELPVFVNTLKPGDLELTKITTWNPDDGEPDGNMDFHFTLTFTEMEGIEMPAAISVRKAKVTAGQQAYSADNAPDELTAEETALHTVELDDNHSCSFTLKAGQKLIVEDLPGGPAYQFQEEIPSGWTLSFENVAGIISPQQTVSGKYTNHYEPGTAVATFIASKKMDGKTPEPYRFAFELVNDTDGSPDKGKVLQTLPNQPSGYVLFDEKYKEAGTYHYIIREVQDKLIAYIDNDGKIVYEDTTSAQAQDNLRKMIFDPTEYHVTVVVTAIEKDGETTLSAAVSYDEEKAQFNNESRPGSLQIRKVPEGLTEANKDSVFTFKVKLTNDAGMPLTESGNMFWYAENDPDAAAAETTPVYEDPAQKEILAADGSAPLQSVPVLQEVIPDRTLMKSLMASPMNTGMTVMLAATGAGIRLGASARTVVESGQLSDTVIWTYYSDDTLVIEPVNGISGSFVGYPNAWNSYATEANVIVTKWWPWYKYQATMKHVETKGRIYANGIIGCMFRQYHALLTADLSHIDVSNASNFAYLFGNDYNLIYVNLHGWQQPDSVSALLWNTSALRVLDPGCLSQELGSGTSGINVIVLEENANIANLKLPNGNWVRTDNTSLVKTTAQLKALTGSEKVGTWVRGDYQMQFTIEFDPNGAAGTMEAQSFDFMNPTNLRTCEFLSDLEFQGWSTNPDAIVAEYEDGALFTGVAQPGGTIRLYAIWASKDSFLINYDAATNGGYVRTQWQRVNGPTDTVTMPVPTNPSNYEFIGWNTKEDGTGTMYKGTVSGAELNGKPDETVVLYAQFFDPSKRAYLVVQHYQENASGDGTYGSSAIDTEYLMYPLNHTVEIPDPKVYKGFRPGVLVSDEGLPKPMPSGGITIRYNYDRTRYTIAYDANGGEGTMDDTEMLGGISMKLPVSRFTKENCLFVGWNTNPDGSGTNYGDGQTVNSIGEDTETVTLYAQWYNMDDAETAEATNGEYTVRCKAGEIIVFPQVPAGTKYEIEEVDLPEGWALKSLVPSGGEVKSAERVDVTATNIYTAKGSANLMAHKRLPGETIESGQFRFQLIDMNETEPKVLETVTNSGTDMAEEIADPSDEEDGTINNPWYGTAPVRFETLEFEKQGVYTYQIKELPGTDTSITYDSHEETVTVLVTDRGDGRLNTQVFYDIDDAVFTNEMSSGELKVTKTLRNATAGSKDAEFKFILYLYDSKGNELTETYTAEISNGTTAEVKSGGFVTMKGGESFTVKGLPHRSTYAVGEVTAAGFEKVSESGTEGTILAGQVQEASITNAYTITTRGLAVIRAQKKLSGREISDGEFIFRLLNSSGELLEEKAAEADGTVTFTGMTYSLEDDGKRYVYFIDEVKGRYMTKAEAEAAGIEVSEDMRVDTETSAEESAPPEGTEEGGAEGESSKEGAPEEAASGGTASEGITEEGEAAGEEAVYLVPDPEMIYDTHREQVGVEIADNGDGSMTATVIYDEDGAVFENIINHGQLKIEKTVTNVTAASAGQKFRFTVSLKDPEGNDIKGLYRVSYSDGTAGSVSAGQSIVLKSGDSAVIEKLPYDTRYEVTEEAVTNFELTGETGSSGIIPPNGTAEAFFENTDVKPYGLSLKAKKELENGELKAGMFSFELIDRTVDSVTYDQVIDTAKASAEGNVTFKSLEYSREDVDKTFTYVIREIAEDDPLIKYDTHEETVEVDVSLDAEGLITAEARYDADGAVFINEKLDELTDVKVTKVWDDEEDKDKLRPASVMVKLLADGKDAKAADSEINGLANGEVTLNADNTWTYTWKDLPACRKGTEEKIAYTVEEVTVPKGYTAEVTGDAKTGYTITNIHKPEVIDIKVTKEWMDENNRYKKRPVSIVVKLLADGKDAKTAGSEINGLADGEVTLNAGNTWTYTWKDLPACRKGTTEKIAYTVEEVTNPDPYTASVSGDMTEGFIITNSYAPEEPGDGGGGRGSGGGGGGGGGSSSRPGFPPGQGPSAAGGGDTGSSAEDTPSGVLGALRNPIEAIQEVLGASRLPQTGQLWWPVPVMLFGGIGLIIAGRKKKKEDEE